MSVQVENLEKNMAKLTVEVPAEELEKAIQAAYMKQKSRISLPGFRKGKVPRHMIEKMYGPEIFYEDAVNIILSKEYPKAAEESGLEIVSRPTVDVEQLEKGKNFIFTAEVAVKPGVTLGKYLGVPVKKADITVSEDEVAAAVERERKSNARMVTVEGRAAENGDTVVIDYEGFVDGEAFEGGKGENHSLVIGSYSFIDTFEEQLIGKNAGDDVTVNVTFPDDYHAPEVAGKPAVFKVKVNEIKAEELPELDDEFAQDVSEFDTLAEYKESVRKKLAERKENEIRRERENEIIDKIIEDSQMEIPDAMVETQTENMIDDFAGRLAQQGMSIEQYEQLTGVTEEKLMEQMKPDALKRIQSGLVLEEIVKAEDIQVSEDDVENEIGNMAEMYGVEVDKLKELFVEGDRENMKKDLAIQKAVDLIVERAEEQAE